MSRPPPARGDARLEAALALIADGADELDDRPAFPAAAFAALAGAGVLGLTLPDAGGRRIPFADELRVLAAVARADGSVGRILDGHLNAVERLCLTAPGTLGPAEQAAVARGELLLGVWGADPAPGEGAPATLSRGPAGGTVLHGVKTFCSGAGGLGGALVVAGDDEGRRRLAYALLTDGVSIDRSWYRAAGLRASESHRVSFDGTPVAAVLGGGGEILREPWFSRDAIRTSATWAGIAGGVVDAAFSLLAARGEPGETTALAVGRMLVARGSIERWIEHAAERAEAALVAEDPAVDAARVGAAALAATAIEARWAIAAAAREIAAEAALACGARPLATGGALSRGRRDLDLFLLQHRLEPLLARHGAAVLGAAAGGG